MKRKARAAAGVEWKGGVHLVGTPLWCDARHTREACFVSSARVAGARRHRQIIATDVTLKLVPEAPARAAHSELAVPYGRPFTLGKLRLELFPAGFVPGSASLAIDTDAARIVYAGVVNPLGGGFAGPAQARTGDVLVVDATFADGRFRFPPVAEVQPQIAGWVAQAAHDGTTPVVLCDPVGIGLELVRLLGDHVPLLVHRALATAVKKSGLTLPAVRRFEGIPPAGAAVLWPIEGRRAAALAGLRRPRVALVGPAAQDPATVARLAVDTAFAWSDQPDRDTLREYIAQTGARDIFLLNATPDSAKALGGVPLGQLALF